MQRRYASDTHSCTVHRNNSSTGWLRLLPRVRKGPGGSIRSLFMCRKSQVHARTGFLPACSHHLSLRVEAESIFTIDVQIAEERRFPAAEAVISHGNGNRHVHAHHPDGYLTLETPSRASAAREDRRTVSRSEERR